MSISITVNDKINQPLPVRRYVPMFLGKDADLGKLSSIVWKPHVFRGYSGPGTIWLFISFLRAAQSIKCRIEIFTEYWELSDCRGVLHKPAGVQNVI